MSTPLHAHEDRIATQQLVDMSKKYLHDNFHKFSDTNKIKIALALITKSMPTQLEGEVTSKIVMEKVTVGNRVMEYSLGN